MLKSFIQKFLILILIPVIITTSVSVPTLAAICQADPLQLQAVKSSKTFTEGIEHSPLILSNHDLGCNSLQGSAYELLNQAEHSILIISFTFSDPEVIRIVNQKASDGVKVQLVIDRAHLSNFSGQLHPDIQVGTRAQGEGHLHHKILVVDHAYIWLGSANFTKSAFTQSKNLSIGFFSPEIGAAFYKEAADIASSISRTDSALLSCSAQLLEVYVLPHHDKDASRQTEIAMNEKAKQKLISLIDQARHHIKISVDVWTYKDASRAVIDALKRGVRVDVVVGNIGEEAVDMMVQAGVHVQQGKNLHHKFMLVDHEILLSGSPNWTMNAFSRSDESFVVLYALNKEQLKALEGALQVAGLPLAMHCNKTGKLTCETQVPTVAESEKIQLIHKTITALNQEISQASSKPEQKRLVEIAKRLSADLVKFIPYMKTAQVPGCCLYEGKQYLARVVAIAEKQERVEKAIKYIKRVSGVDQKVSEYFHKTLEKLQSGVNTPLPDYFHATRAGLESIVSGQKIIQSKTGVTGRGTYVSCNNEGDHGYGSHTFAIDEGCLVDTKATFRTGRHPQTNVFYSLWASVLMDLPVNDESIAFIDTSANDVPYVKALLEAKNLHIEVVDRKTAESILRIFDLTTKRRELPSFFWNKHESRDYLPKNMYPRSPEGTFRQFTFS